MRPRRPPSARSIARMMTTDRHHMSKTEALLVAVIETAAPALAVARDLMDRFHAMIRTRNTAALDSWIGEARQSLLASLATSIAADYDAVRNALNEPCSNGQTEGQITNEASNVRPRQARTPAYEIARRAVTKLVICTKSDEPSLIAILEF